MRAGSGPKPGRAMSCVRLGLAAPDGAMAAGLGSSFAVMLVCTATRGGLTTNLSATGGCRDGAVAAQVLGATCRNLGVRSCCRCWSCAEGTGGLLVVKPGLRPACVCVRPRTGSLYCPVIL